MSARPWTQIIESDRPDLSLNLRELWRYRDLLALLARRDVVTLYKQTILGPLWYVLQPLLTSLLFVVIFTRVARISTDGVPPLLFYMSGVVFWNFFAESLKSTSDSFVLNAELFQKVYFPRAVVPIAKVLAGTIKYLIQLALLAAVWVYYATQPGAGLALTPAVALVLPLSAAAAALGLGVGLLLSSLTYKYRDLQYLVGFGVQLLMYGTPVIYPLSSAPEALREVIGINPMTPLVEAFRYATVGVGSVSAQGLIYAGVAVAAVTLAGLYSFNVAQRTFADTV